MYLLVPGDEFSQTDRAADEGAEDEQKRQCGDGEAEDGPAGFNVLRDGGLVCVSG